MSYILHIETATTVCSVSVSHQGELIFLKELNAGFTHAENLHLFILEAIRKVGINPGELSAIAVSKGPGSYTGLRIGVSTAKGLAYALNIPLIGVDTLQIMAAGARSKTSAGDFYCPMIDARRMEVYTAVYDPELRMVSEVEACIVDEHSIEKFSSYPGTCFFGDGMPKCKVLLAGLTGAFFCENIWPSAKDMVKLAYGRYMEKAFENVAYFEPFYLKDFMAGKMKKGKSFGF